jgi:hypothetical protein
VRRVGRLVVGRRGFEPLKAFRQLIYSQPPLAAWVPPRLSECRCNLLPCQRRPCPAPEARRGRTSWAIKRSASRSS